ncbi:MAG: riboflavin biosynthesis protein RibF [Clostridiales bacterium]|jgi:riboflavin kinase/FMN adenylyltransferase|nr:riboflavin biosynthesis protein RibF [Clostridiales bacterium]
MIKICNTYSLDDLPLGTKGRVIALGLFDGIHQGHKDIIRKAVVTAERDGLTSTVQTFRNLIKNDSRSLYSMEEKHELIGSLGADELFVLDFDAVKDMEPEQYLTDVLLYRAVADTLVLGEDYRFGRGAKGDVNLIREFAKANDIRVIVLKDHLLEGTGRKISTTWLREALSEGDADLARDLCGGRNYSYTGYCVQGKMMGRTMGFPTANINIPEDKFVVRRGVYVSRVILGQRVLYGVTNIGRRPTLENAENDVAETFIFDFDEDIYGAKFTVELLHFLRPEEHYGSKDELILAVENNKVQARDYIKNLI